MRMTEANGNGNIAKSTTKKFIGYKGELYDVTNFIKRHPGGEVIEKFVGHDATHVIETAHGKDVLRLWKPVDFANSNVDLKHFHYNPSLFGKQMLALHVKLKREGYYDNSVGWSFRKFLFVISIIITIFFLLYNYPDVFPIQCLCSFLMAAFWQQSGMLMHDLMHSQMFQNYKIDEKLGIFFGTFCFGISARWWKDEHTIHHALTNTVEYSSGFVDPQAFEEVWAQNEKLFPLMCQRIHQFCIKVQYWTFLPLCVFVGRIGILIDSYRTERRKDVWIAFILHLCWISLLLSWLPNWKARCLFYLGACVGEGILHIQLLINHYSKPFFEKKEMHETEFFQAMVEANINITCPRWMDWFHGGLNFHIEHHCFPRLPRNRYREVSAMIKKICEENDIVYDECSFTCGIKRTLDHLKSVSKLYSAMQEYN